MEAAKLHAISLVMHSSDSLKPVLDQLPKEIFWDDLDLYQWEGFWYIPSHIDAIIASQKHFQARDDDVILTSPIKTGTTWLKALCTSIMGRESSVNDENEEDDPLVKNPPHANIQTLETHVYVTNPPPDLSGMPSPRLFHSHMPYNTLPNSIRQSKCKIVYIARNPKDTLVSMWHFFNSLRGPEEQHPFEQAFECFCNGVHPWGPFFDHVLQYWKESLKMPHKVLFLKFEDLKRDPKGQVKRLASFLGKPFENEDAVDKVLWRCSLERLKNLEVNKNGFDPSVGMPNSSFFRLGVVGDWKNNFTTEMQERFDRITLEKFKEFGLEFDP